MTSSWKYLLGILSLVAITIWLSIVLFPDQKLHLIACDVGQGDAILAVYGRTQILIDGGPGRKVLDCLSRHMPFWDKKLELVLLTHPQKDHFGGLIEVFKSYQIDNFAATALNSSSQEYEVLKRQVGGSGVRIVNPTAGMEIRFNLIHLDIFHPPKEAFLASENSGTPRGVSHRGMLAPASGAPSEQASQSINGVLGTFTTARNPNEFSIVAILRYKEFDALLTGDIPPEVADLVAEQLAVSPSILLGVNSRRSIEYIKVPHHGSKNGLTEQLLDIAAPEIAVISVGKNSYGHPHEETLKMLRERGIKTFRTDLPAQVGGKGDVVVITDGIRWGIND